MPDADRSVTPGAPLSAEEVQALVAAAEARGESRGIGIGAEEATAKHKEAAAAEAAEARIVELETMLTTALERIDSLEVNAVWRESQFQKFAAASAKSAEGLADVKKGELSQMSKAKIYGYPLATIFTSLGVLEYEKIGKILKAIFGG